MEKGMNAGGKGVPADGPSRGGKATAIVTEEQRPQSAYEASNCCGKLCFSWVSPMVKTGFRRQLTEKDLWKVGKRQSGAANYERLKENWEKELHHAKHRRSLWRAVWRTYRSDLILSFSIMCIWIALGLVSGGYVMSELVDYYNHRDEEGVGIGLMWVGIFAALEISRSFAVNQMWVSQVIGGVRLRSAARMMIYEKALKLRNSRIPVAAVVNLVSSDSQRLLHSFQYATFLVSTPVCLIAIMIWLGVILGWAALAGFVVVGLVYLLQGRLAKIMVRLRRAAVRFTDERVRTMSEVLGGIKLIKLYGWEASFAKKVGKVRSAESKQLRRAAFFASGNVLFALLAPSIVGFATFACHVWWTGEYLRAEDAFPFLALFNVLRFPLSVLPISVRMASEASVSLQRMQAFFQLTEVSEDDKPKTKEDSPETAIGFDSAVLQWQSAAELENEAKRFNTLVHQRATPKKTKDGASKGDGANEKEADESNVAAAVGAVWWEQKDGSGKSKALSEEMQEATGALHNLNLQVKKGEVVALVGSVGAGKSSILSALLGNMLLKGGAMYLNGKPAYVGHPATVFNNTVKGNILFGTEYDEARYKHVLEACALLPDLEALPAGDETEVGERGVNLSGGQKARIALARALYSPDSSVYLLDDPLSAVDSHTGKHLWRECIRGILHDKGATVLMATHQLQVLPDCDRVVVLNDGQVQDMGTFEELSGRGIDLRRLMAIDSESGSQERGSGSTEEAAAAADVHLQESKEAKGEEAAEGSTAVQRVAVRRRGSTGASSVSGDIAGGSEGEEEAAAIEDADKKEADIDTSKDAGAPSTQRSGRLITVEEQSKGGLHAQVFLDYMAAAGGKGVAAVLMVLVLAGSVARLAADYFISFWVDDVDRRLKAGEAGFNQDVYIGVLGAIVGGAVLFQLLRGVCHATVTVRAARRMHDEVFVTIMRATSSFFDTTPIGRILNRVSGDMDIVDVRMPQVLELALNLCAFCGLTVIAIIVATPWFAIVMVPIMGGFLYVIRYFRRSVRELQRLEGITRSPIVSNVQATVQGLTTIRAFGKADVYREYNSKHVDRNTTAFFAWYGCNRWVAVRFDALTYSMAIACALIGVLTDLDAGLAGIIVVYALQISGVFQFATRQAAETESLFTSVERVLHYIRNVPKEPIYSDKDHSTEPKDLGKCCGRMKVPPIEWHRDLVLPEWDKANWNPTLQAKWPSKGEIQFKSVVARYRPELDPALRSLSLTLPGGASVGIVGRTGSGKSTTTLTLFRLLESEGGSISIDGQPISAVQLFQLRSKLAIIPQDPVLFTGTIRSNLDPFGDFAEERLWEVLRSTDLEGFVRSHAMGLDKEVAEGGTNLSVGQRQLICLARALLRGAKIVVLDEATSAIDVNTDAMVQRVVAEQFKGCTLLIIAHRLETIMTCDYIAGLHQGSTEEFGHPAKLLGFTTDECTDFLEAATRESSLHEEKWSVESLLTTSLVKQAPTIRNSSGLLANLVIQTGEESAQHLTAMALLSRGLKVQNRKD